MATVESDPLTPFLAAIKSDATRKAYLWALDKYADFHKTTDYKELLAGEKPTIQDRFHRFVLSLNTDNTSKAMQDLCFTALKLFHYMNHIELDWKWLAKQKQNNGQFRKDQPYTKDDIEKILAAAGNDDRLKAIVLLFATSGVRLGGLATMKLKDIGSQDPDRVLAMRVYSGYKEEYLTFATPQATRHLYRYLKQRYPKYKNLGEIPKDEPLISHVAFTERAADEAHLGDTIRTLLIKAGMRPLHGDPAERHDVKRVHGFRKFFASTIANETDISYERRERMLGHTVRTLDKSYIYTGLKELLPEYRKAVPALTFDNASKPL